MNGTTTEQMCLAALIATLDPKKQEDNIKSSKHVFKKPKSTYFDKIVFQLFLCLLNMYQECFPEAKSKWGNKKLTIYILLF